MTEFEKRVEFPCGYKFKVKAKLGWASLFGFVKISEESMDVCPLHGKDCLKEMKKKCAK